NPTFTIAPGKQTRFTIGYELARDRRTADRGVTSFPGRTPHGSIFNFYGNPDDSHVRSNVNLLSGTLDHQIGKLNIHNRTLFGDYDRFYQNYVPGAVSSDKARVLLSAYNNATQRRNLFNQTDITASLTTGRLKHVFLWGGELGRQKSHNFRNTGFFNNTTTSISVPYSAPTIDTPITFRQSATDANNRVRTNLAAAYLQDQIEISKHLQFVGGLRFDYFDLDFHNNRTGENLRRID